MPFKKQIQIKTAIPYVIIFIISFLINFFCLNPNNPVNYPDTQTYLNVTSEIKQFRLPDFSVRTPTYPLYQSIFKTPKSSIIPTLIIASIGSLLLYWIIIQLTSKRKMAFLTTIFVMADYGTTNFYSTILTESIAPAIIIFSIFSHIVLNIPLLIVSDFLIMFIKPTFIILPLGIKFFLFLFSKKDKRKILIISGIINILFILFFLGYNYKQTRKIEISSIGNVNTLGVAINYGYLENQPFYDDAPSEVINTINIYQKNRTNSPWELTDLIKKEYPDKNIDSYLKKINSYFIWKNKKSFIIKTIQNFPKNFTVERHFYSNINNKISKLGIFNFFEELYNAINKFKFIGIIIVSFIFLSFIIHKNKKTTIIGILLLFSVYTTVANTIFSYGEFSRLRQPIDPILSIIVLLPFFYLKPNDKNN